MNSAANRHGLERPNTARDVGKLTVGIPSCRQRWRPHLHTIMKEMRLLFIYSPSCSPNPTSEEVVKDSHELHGDVLPRRLSPEEAAGEWEPEEITALHGDKSLGQGGPPRTLLRVTAASSHG